MADSSRGYQQLFAELKRRKVFRVMAAYGVIGFGVIEAADAIFPRVALPDWTVTLVVWLTLLGFPIAVILAWAFESTPEGVKRTADATPEEISEIMEQPASRRWMPGLLALAGAALLFGGWWLGQRGTGEAGLSLAPAGAEAADFPKVAVLPFEDLGGNEEGDPLLSLHAEVLNKLTTIGDLRVTQPASAAAYANTTKDVRTIAEELGNVDYLLQGSVRRAGNRARIDVRLVDVATNDNYPIEDWDGEVTVENVFEVQSAIALKVARQLQAQLSPQDIERLETGLSTSNLEAINLYYRALNALEWGQKTETWKDALGYAEAAVKLAPEYVEAWALIARLRAFAERTGTSVDGTALEAVEAAESLAYGSPWALRARAYYLLGHDESLSRALELMEEAGRQSPSDADILKETAHLQYRLGDFETGLRTMKRSVALDPRNPDRLTDLAGLLGSMARWKAADELVERALAIAPDDEVTKIMKVNLVEGLSGNPARARATAAELGLDPEVPIVASNLAGNALRARDYDEAAELLPHVGLDNPVGTASRLSRMVAVEDLRGGNAMPYRDSLIALVDSVPEIAQNYKPLAATARFLADDADGGLALLRKHVDEARASANVTRYTLAINQAAWAYARFGFREEALAALDQAIARPFPPNQWAPLVVLERHPELDAFRDDPRFQALLARQAAYEAEQARLAEEQGPWLP